MSYIIQGFLVGIAYVAPIGTQNLFVINTSLTQKRMRILITALIVMFFDISLSVACFYGVGALVEKSLLIELLVGLVGSLFVLWIGIGLIRSKGSMEGDSKTDIPIMKVVLTACVVTWFNPQAIIDGTMLFGASRIALPGQSGMLFISGAALASATWWLGLSTFVSLFKDKITPKLLRIINIVCGIIIVFYGLKLFYSGIIMAKDYF